jgi:hypothetical protein
MVLPLQIWLSRGVILEGIRRPGSIPRIGWRRAFGQRVPRVRKMVIEMMEQRDNYPSERSANAPRERPRRR